MTVALTQQLKELDIGLVVLAGFMVHPHARSWLHAYPNAILNVHPALIPSFCGEGFYGLHVHEAALAYGVKAHRRHRPLRQRGLRRRAHRLAAGGSH